MGHFVVISIELGRTMLKKNWVASHSDVKMPGIIYGTAWKKEQTRDLVVNALQAGFAGIDTAGQPKHYNEPMVGEALQIMEQQGLARESYYLQTKYTPVSSQDPENLPYDPSFPIAQQVAVSFENSIINLKTSYIDGYILHSPLQNHELSMQAWSAMEDLYKAGQVRQLGISNCYNFSEMRAIYNDAEIKPAIVQNRFYKDTHYEKELRQWCREKNIIFQSFWSLTANKHLLESETVQSLCQIYNKTSAQIFFRFLTQLNILPLTGTSSSQHMYDDLAIFEFHLADADIEKMDLLLRA